MHEVHRVVMVEIVGDREKVLAFQEWALKTGIYRHGGYSTVDSLVCYVDARHAQRIRDWFDDSAGETCELCGGTRFVSKARRCYSTISCVQRRAKKGYDVP